MLSRGALAIFGGERLRADEPTEESGVNFLLTVGLDFGEADEVLTLAEVALLPANGLLVEDSVDLVPAVFLKATGDAPGDAAILLCVRGLVVDFVTAEAALVTEAWPALGEESLSELEIFFFDAVGERTEVAPVDDFLLPSGDEAPPDFPPRGVVNFEPPFRPSSGLPFEDEALVVEVSALDPLTLDLGEVEASLLVGVGFLEPRTEPERPRALSITPTTLISSED